MKYCDITHNPPFWLGSIELLYGFLRANYAPNCKINWESNGRFIVTKSAEIV